MISAKTILITGVAGYWGSRVAAELSDPGPRRRRLATQGELRIIGIDTEPPGAEIRGLDFIQADVRNQALGDLLRHESVQAVCHLAFVETVHPSRAAFDLNVVGTATVLGACAEAGVRKVVLRSSTAVYGARPSNPAFLTEEHALRGSERTGTIRDLLEIEKLCSGFRRQAPGLLLTILRFPSIVGPTADTAMVRFLREPWVPMLLGYDPRMQLIHEQDVIEALAHALLQDVSGVFNVAAEDVMPLNKVRGLARKGLLPVLPPLPSLAIARLRGHVPHLDRFMPIELDYLRYPWVADLTRMRSVFGFVPRYTGEDAVREFAQRQRMGVFGSGSAMLARDEERLQAVLDERRSPLQGQQGPGLPAHPAPRT